MGCINAKSQITRTSPCSPYVIQEYDDITGEYSFYSQVVHFSDTLNDNAIKLVKIDGGKNWLHITMLAKDGMCFSQYTKIYFLFTDNTRINLPNIFSSNCYGAAEISIGLIHNNTELLQLFGTKSIKAIRIMNFSDSSERYLTEKESKDLLLIVQCLLKNPD